MVTAATTNIYTPQTYSDDELLAAMKKMLARNQSPPQPMLHPMLKFVQNELPTAIAARRYRDASDFERATRLLHQFIDGSNEYNRIKSKRDRVLAKIAGARQSLVQTIELWDQKLKEAEAAQVRHVQELKQSQQRESAEFESDWSDPDFLLEFRKPSSLLLQLRDREHALALAKSFAEAEEIGRRADQLEREELAKQNERATVAMKAHYQHLLERHSKEMSCVEMKDNEEIECMKREKQRAMQPFQLKIAKLEVSIPPQKSVMDCVKTRPTRTIHTPKSIHDARQVQILPVVAVPVKGIASARRDK
jgi:hypothetical protein